MVDFTISQSGRGTVFGSDRTALHIPTSATRMAPLVPVLSDFIGKANEVAAVVKPELLAAQLVRPIAPLLAAANRAISVARENAREVAAADARALIPPAAVAEAAARFGAEIRASIRNASPAEQFNAVNRASAVELAALLENDGTLSGLVPEALKLARERALKLFHVERTGIAGGNPAVPSLNRLVAIGTDAEATATEAEVGLELHKQRVEEVETDERVLQEVLRFIAVALAIPPAQALDMIKAAG